MQTTIKGIPIEVDIVRKPNKNIYFRFTDKLHLQITCHKWVSEKELEKIIASEESSLYHMYQKVTEKKQQQEQFMYLGEPYTILWDEHCKKVQIEDGMIYAKNEAQLEKFWMKECYRIFEERLEKCLLLFDTLPAFTLRVRKMKTRWGVNNYGSHTITLNSELLRQETSLIDYVIIHELCHFKEANHSSRFWHEVEMRYPYYKLARKKLRSE